MDLKITVVHWFLFGFPERNFYVCRFFVDVEVQNIHSLLYFRIFSNFYFSKSSFYFLNIFQIIFFMKNQKNMRVFFVMERKIKTLLPCEHQSAHISSGRMGSNLVGVDEHSPALVKMFGNILNQDYFFGATSQHPTTPSSGRIRALFFAFESLLNTISQN